MPQHTIPTHLQHPIPKEQRHVLQLIQLRLLQLKMELKYAPTEYKRIKLEEELENLEFRAKQSQSFWSGTDEKLRVITQLLSGEKSAYSLFALKRSLAEYFEALVSVLYEERNTVRYYMKDCCKCGITPEDVSNVHRYINQCLAVDPYSVAFTTDPSRSSAVSNRGVRAARTPCADRADATL